MHGVAAEIAEEVIVLLQDDNSDPGARKQQSMNKTRGTATGNTNLGSQNLRHSLRVLATARVLGGLGCAFHAFRVNTEWRLNTHRLVADQAAQ